MEGRYLGHGVGTLDRGVGTVEGSRYLGWGVGTLDGGVSTLDGGGKYLEWGRG